jgi:hypothetical protein
MASRLVRANAVTVNDVLDGHKLLEIDCADRVYLTLSVPCRCPAWWWAARW